MLTPKNLAIAETLAVEYPDLDIAAVSSPVVAALNSNLAGVLPLTLEDYKERAPALSREGIEYKAIEDQVTTALAENTRATFEQIGVYAKGVVNSVVNAINKAESGCITEGSSIGKNYLLGMLDMEFVKTDFSFYSSLIYPQSVPNTSMSFSQIDVKQFEKIRFARWDSARIVEWIGIDNPEINEQLMSSNINLSSALCDLAYGYSLPFEIDDKTSTIDFTKPYLNCAETMFAQYIILCKMMSSDAPFEGLTSGSLNDYRSNIALLHSAYSTALIALKKSASALSNVPIRIVEKEPGSVRENPVMEGGKVFPRVKSKLTVYYNEAGLEICVDNKMGMAEIVAACLYMKYVSLQPSQAASLLSNGKEAKQYFSDLADKVNSLVISEKANYYGKFIREGVTEFVMSRPELAEVMADSSVAEPAAAFVDKLLSAKDYGNSIAYHCKDSKMSLTDATFNSELPVQFLTLIGCKDAAEILFATTEMGRWDQSEVDKRHNLHCAIINHYVKKLLTVG